jgi:nucleotide-binding universal stress UspA family protein
LTLSGSCRAALAVARNLAREIKARLLLLHIVQLNIAGEERGIQRTRLVNELCRIAENQLQQLADRMGGQITTEVLVCEGRPAEAIVAAAKHLRAEMIIMRTNGHRGWRRWLHRNTALHVMRQSGCKTCLVLSGKRDTAANMIIVDHTTINPLPKDVFSRENTNPLRSLARVLFS